MNPRLFRFTPRLFGKKILQSGAFGIIFFGSLLATAEEFERSTLAMGTRLRLRIQARDHVSAVAGSEVALEVIRKAERRLSNWRLDSEVSRLNGMAAGEIFPVSQDFRAEWQAAEECRQLTNGAFDARIGSLVELWDLRGQGRRPSAEELSIYLENRAYMDLDWVGNASSKGSASAHIATGAYGKGAALDGVRRSFEETTGVNGVWLDFGGQITHWGWPTNLSIALAHPRHRDTTVLHFSPPEGSVATSGNSERGLVVDGHHFGHLLDPRTAFPVEDFGSVTVWAESSFLADCLSTGLYVMGPREGQAWAANLLGMMVPMVISGYLGQVSVDPLGRKIWTVVHVTTLLIWILASLIHLMARLSNGKLSDDSPG